MVEVYIISKNERGLLKSFLLVALSETAILLYAFYIVPPFADLNLGGFLFGPILGEFQSLPTGLFYLVPILLLFAIVIFPFGCSRISIWLIGLVLLYVEIFIYTEVVNITYNAFGFLTEGHMGGVLLFFMPFWCIFFFLWELLFCGIAKLWRRKRDSKDRGME